MFRTMRIAVMVLALRATCLAAEPQASPKNKSRADSNALVEVARRGLEVVLRPTADNHDAYAGVFVWLRRVLYAELDVAENVKDRVAAWEKHLARMAKLEQVATDLHSRGVIVELELLEA